MRFFYRFSEFFIIGIYDICANAAIVIIKAIYMKLEKEIYLKPVFSVIHLKPELCICVSNQGNISPVVEENDDNDWESIY